MRVGAEGASEVGGLAVDEGVLESPVGRALGAPAKVLGWRAERLRAGAGNPTSAGVYRLAGEALAGGASRTWTLVMKAFQSPTSVGRPDFGDEVDHWNYWLRELRAFEAGLLTDLPGGLRAPTFLGAVELETRAWLWIEDIGDVERAGWTLDACCRAARHLGLFEGAYLTGPLPDAAWLARGMMRQWAALLPSLSATIALVEGPETRSLLACLAAPGRLLDGLDRLPHTLSHQDANVDNLLLRIDATGASELLALDWQLMGLSPPGAVVGELLNSLGDEAGPLIWPSEAVVLEAYRSGLQEAGAQPDPVAIDFAYRATTVLRQGIFMLARITEELGSAENTEASRSAVVEGFVSANRQILARLAGFAERLFADS